MKEEEEYLSAPIFLPVSDRPMPIICQQTLNPLSREEFGRLSYDLMADVFAIRNKLGRFFDEKHYKQALALRRQDVILEVPVRVNHQTFSKTYFLDVLLASGAIIEFKATDALSQRHKAQLLHYLMMTDLEHGLLINVRPEQVAKAFVNCAIRRCDQLAFRVSATDWREEIPGGKVFRDVLIALLEDWGASLELSLYEEALTHFLGGESNVLRPVKIHLDGATLGQQMFRLAADRVAFKLTALVSRFSQQRFAHHARQLVRHTDLDALLWANLGRHEITFSCLQ
jgi:GxxExxY protein